MDQLLHLLATLSELAGLAGPEGLPSGTSQAVPPNKAIHGLMGDTQPLGQGALGPSLIQQGLDLGRRLAAEEAFARTHRTMVSQSPWTSEGDTPSAWAMA